MSGATPRLTLLFFRCYSGSSSSLPTFRYNLSVPSSVFKNPRRQQFSSTSRREQGITYNTLPFLHSTDHWWRAVFLVFILFQILVFRFLYLRFLKFARTHTHTHKKVVVSTFTLGRRQGKGDISNHFYIIQIICVMLLQIILYSDLIFLPGRSDSVFGVQRTRFH